jgi:cold shock CspA family protein
MSSSVTPVLNNDCERYTGRVKWFNNKSGYGFATIVSGDRVNNDIFIHHSAIDISDQYKYLVQGEYIEFNLIKTDNATHEYQASNITGINKGVLMCQTRHDYNLMRGNYNGQEDDTNNQKQKYVEKKSSDGYKEYVAKDWALVRKPQQLVAQKPQQSDVKKKQFQRPRTSQVSN